MKQGAAKSNSSFSFAQLGHSLHFEIADYQDLQEILQLDEALWIATTAPVSTLNTDATFLALIDSDKDGRVRAEEIKDAIRFLLRYHTHYSAIKPDNFLLSLAHINTETELGKRIVKTAEKVTGRLDASSETVDLDQVRKVKKEVLEGGLDEAGIVLPEAANDDKVKQCILDIISTVGGRQHPNGKTGVDQESVDIFYQQCRSFIDWRLEAGAIGSDEVTQILPLGKATADGSEILQKLSKKLTQYFLLCDIKRLNPELLEQAIREPEVNIALNLLQIEQAESYLADAPLCRLNADGELDLSAEINPYFRVALEELVQRVVKPLLGEETKTITKDSFRKLLDIFKPYRGWLERKPDVNVDHIEEGLVLAYLEDPMYRENLEFLIQESHRTSFVLDNLKELERLILYQALLLPLVNSFVSFPKLYNPDERALFEEGTLIMDGRHFSLAIRVDDREHHIATSKGSNIFVIYCELYGKDGKKRCEIAVPVTSGNRGNLHLNKWGIFNDIHGDELHAKIIDIVENPISIGEAVADPFRRINRTFFSRLEDFSSKTEERLFSHEEKKKDKKKDDVSGGLLAGGSVAVAAIGSAFAFITKTLASLTAQTLLLSLLVVVAIIAIPAGIAAYYKLSRRDLSSILEGSGWGINARMRLTTDQACCFTFRPQLPTGKQ